jgi:hypothetical protein
MEHSQSNTSSSVPSNWISTELDGINTDSPAYNLLFEGFPWNSWLNNTIDLSLLDTNDPIIAALLQSTNIAIPDTIDPHLLTTPSAIVNPTSDTNQTGKQQADSCASNTMTSLENPMNQIVL